jgi:hypothetical protein
MKKPIQKPKGKESQFYKYKATRTAMEKVKLNALVKAYPTLEILNSSDYNFTKEFFEDLQDRMFNRQDHFIITVSGETGIGKSLLKQAIALKIDPKITVKNICFKNEDLLNKAQDIKRRTILIKDEEPVGVGVGSLREELEMVNLQEITRKFQLSLLFGSPTERTHKTAHYNLLVIDKDYTRKLTRVAIENPYSEKKEFIGYIIVKVNPSLKTNKLWKKYNKIKDKFIDETLKRKSGARINHEEINKRIKKAIKKDSRETEIKVTITALCPQYTQQEKKDIFENFLYTNRTFLTHLCPNCIRFKTKKDKQGQLSCPYCSR